MGGSYRNTKQSCQCSFFARRTFVMGCGQGSYCNQDMAEPFMKNVTLNFTVSTQVHSLTNGCIYRPNPVIDNSRFHPAVILLQNYCRWTDCVKKDSFSWVDETAWFHFIATVGRALVKTAYKLMINKLMINCSPQCPEGATQLPFHYYRLCRPTKNTNLTSIVIHQKLHSIHLNTEFFSLQLSVSAEKLELTIVAGRRCICREWIKSKHNLLQPLIFQFFQIPAANLN